nr:hypothetical protein [Tanacetum cinerariifolium]
MGTRKPNRRGRKAGRLNTNGETRNLRIATPLGLDAPHAIQALAKDPEGYRASSRQGKEKGRVPAGIPVTCRPPRYAEMLGLRDLGPNTLTGVPYTEDRIMVMVQKGKQRGHIPDVGRVLAGHGRDVVRSDDRMAQLLTQLQLQNEVASGSGSDGGEDDKSGEDEDTDEDKDADGLDTLVMERGFLSQKGNRVGRGVKEKQVSMADKSVEVGMLGNVTGEQVVNGKQSSLVATVSVTKSDGMLNDVTLTVVKKKQSSLEDTTGLGSFTPLPTQVNTSAGNAPVESIRAVSERFANSAYGFFLRKKVAYLVVVTYNNPLILKKWHPDENLLMKDVSSVSVWVKLYGVPVTAFSEDGLSAIATKLGTPLMLDFYTSDMCIQSRGACEKKTVKKPSQASRGVSVGPKMAFKSQNEYRTVTKKPNTSSSGNKKKYMKPTIELSNSNPFGVLNSVDNDVEFGTNGGTCNLGNNEATPSGSSFMNIDNDVEFASSNLIGDKIDKIERQISEGKLRLLDNDENPLVPTGIVESDSEVDVVYDEKY